MTRPRRLSLVGSAVAVAAAQLSRVRRFESEDIAGGTVMVAPITAQRCTCPDCVRADATDKYGYFQWRLPLSGGGWR